MPSNKTNPAKSVRSSLFINSWDAKRLGPLLFCVVGLGWIASRVVPERVFLSNGILLFLAALALPLAAFGFIALVKPGRLGAPVTQFAIGAPLFTGTIGLFLLFSIQSLGRSQMEHFHRIGSGTIGGVLTLGSWIIGWLYAGLSPEMEGSFHSFLSFIFGVGLLEECTKIIPVAFFLSMFRKSPSQELRLAKEMAVIGILSGFGFGIAEALWCYSPSSGVAEGNIWKALYGGQIARWFSCVPSHAAWTGVLALVVWVFRDEFRKERSKDAIKTYLLILILISISTAVLHGIYDILCRFWLLGALLSGASVILLLIVIRSIGEKVEPDDVGMGPLLSNLQSLVWKSPKLAWGIMAAYLIAILILSGFGESV